MKLATKTIIATLLLSAGMAFANKATDPDAKARQTLMGTIAMNTKVLGEMAGGKVAFDPAAAEAAKTALADAAAKIPVTFEPQGTDADSKASPEIWTNWDDFVTRADALNKAALGVDATTVDGVGAGMAVIGATCKSCHSKYQI